MTISLFIVMRSEQYQQTQYTATSIEAIFASQEEAEEYKQYIQLAESASFWIEKHKLTKPQKVSAICACGIHREDCTFHKISNVA